MRLLQSTFLLLTLACLGSLGAEIETEGDVLVLTEKNFKDAIKDNEFILVEFYAPWCGHCKALAPEYEKAAGALLKSGSNIKLGKVDATVEKSLGDEFKIKGFPTLKFFKNGIPKDYSGKRDADGIVDWLEKHSGPPAKTLTTADEAKALTEEKDVVVIGFFKDLESAGAKEFIKAAESNDDQTFAITTASAVMDKYEVKADAIVLIKKFDEGRVDFAGKMKAKDINAWVGSEAIPLINEFSSETAPKIFGSDVKTHFLLIVSKESADFEKHRDALKASAKANKGKMIFVFIDSDAESNKQVLEFFGLNIDNAPFKIIYEMEKNAKYVDKESKVDDDSVAKFVNDFFDGKLKRDLKSEDVPEDWDKNPVKVLVSKNFKEVALDKKKDVFVEFYAPWCGHCKALVPIWDKLGEHFKDSDKVVIAKMDSTANEVEEVTIEGFPTLKLFKAGSNEVVDYSGKREFEDMKKFLETGEVEAEDGGDDYDDEDYDEEDAHDRDEL